MFFFIWRKKSRRNRRNLLTQVPSQPAPTTQLSLENGGKPGEKTGRNKIKSNQIDATTRGSERERETKGPGADASTSASSPPPPPPVSSPPSKSTQGRRRRRRHPSATGRGPTRTGEGLRRGGGNPRRPDSGIGTSGEPPGLRLGSPPRVPAPVDRFGRAPE